MHLKKDDVMEYFFNNNIAQIDVIVKDMDEPNIRIFWKKIPKNMEKCFHKADYYYNNITVKKESNEHYYIWISKKNITHISKRKKDLEQILDANKFGL